MYFLIAVVAVNVLFIGATFAALTNQNPGVTVLTFCPLAGALYPLLWVAVYRVSRRYSVIARKG